MTIPQHIDYYPSSFATDRVKSDRAYIVHEIDTTTVREFEYESPERTRRIRAIYQDEETGIMTADVPAFEAWMKRVQLAPVAPTAEDE